MLDQIGPKSLSDFWNSIDQATLKIFADMHLFYFFCVEIITLDATNAASGPDTVLEIEGHLA